MGRSLEEVDAHVIRLDKVVCGNGKPGLEEKFEDRIEKAVRHERENRLQANMLLSVQIDKETAERGKQHDANNKKWVDSARKQDRAQWLLITTLVGVVVILVLKFAGH
jgi:hypothetical protein